MKEMKRMKKRSLSLMVIVVAVLFMMTTLACSLNAASLRWSKVESAENNVIVGYKAYFVSANPDEDPIIRDTDQLAVDLSNVGLVDGIIYTCSVRAVNSAGYVGPPSEKVTYNSEWPFPEAVSNPKIYISYELVPK